VGVGTLLDTSLPIEEPKGLLKKLINNDADMRSRLEHATLKEEVEVSTLNLYDPKFSIVGNRVMLVGEAAGLVNPFNGEGIQFALLSGRWASEVVATAISSDFSAESLSAYSARVENELGDGLRTSAIMLKLIRNRSLNPVWLKALEIMGERGKKDTEYARLTSGILSGMIFPDQKITAKIVNGVLQEAAISTGATFADILKDPATAPQTLFRITETGIEVVSNLAQDPMGLFTWGVDSATKITEIAATAFKQLIKDGKK
jgi:menaquinone-9 beta-reductase